MATPYEINGWLRALWHPGDETQLGMVAKSLEGVVKENPDPKLIDEISRALAKVHGPYLTGRSSARYYVENLAEAIAPHLTEEQADNMLKNRWRFFANALANTPKVSPETQVLIAKELANSDEITSDIRSAAGFLVTRKDISPSVPDILLGAKRGEIRKEFAADVAMLGDKLTDEQQYRVIEIGRSNYYSFAITNLIDSSPNMSPEKLERIYRSTPPEQRSHVVGSIVAHPNMSVELQNEIADKDPTVLAARKDLTDENLRKVYSRFVEGSNHRSDDFIENNYSRLTPEELAAMVPNAREGTAKTLARYLSPEHLTAAIKATNGDTKKAYKEELTWRDPDKVHKERVNVAFGTNKMRILRDKIGEMGHDQATPKELPRELVQAVGNTGRLPNGNYSARLLQQAIDAQPRTPFNVSHAVWRGQQKHSSEPSKVFQLNLTTEMAQKLKDAGVYDTYRKLWNRSNSGAHPIGLPGIGWVRWTGSAKDGIHIDELQSDFGQRLSRMIDEQAQQAREQGWSEADIQREVDKLKKEFPEKDIDKINEIVFGGKHSSHVLMEAFHEWARSHKAEVKEYKPVEKKKWGSATREQKLWEEDHTRAIDWFNSPEGEAWRAANPEKTQELVDLEEKLYWGADSFTVSSGALRVPLHENEHASKFALLVGEYTGKNFFDASMARYIPGTRKTPTKKQYESLVGAKVATWQPETKAPISGLRSDKPLPKHIVVGHRDVPEKMGFRPSIYGNLPTQKGDIRHHHGSSFFEAAGRDPAKGLPEDQVVTYDDGEKIVRRPKGAPTMEEEIRKSEGFLEAVLGAPAAQALIKTAERSPVMASAMLPRAVIAWLDFASRWPYIGTIPGCENTHIEFTKSESGFTGAIEADGQSYEFQDAPMLEVAAAVGVALGWDSIQPSDRLTKAQVESVGSQMDLLVKATFLAKATKQGHDKPGAPAAPMQNTNPKQAGFDTPAPPQKGAKRNAFKSEPCEKCNKKECKCDKKSRTIKVSKAEAMTTCSVCGAAQWDSGDLTFCYCLRDLRKNASSNSTDDGYEVTFGPRWGDSDIQVFLDMVGK